jgi:hypothetical protein
MTRFKDSYGSFLDRKRCRFDRPGLDLIVFFNSRKNDIEKLNLIIQQFVTNCSKLGAKQVTTT